MPSRDENPPENADPGRPDRPGAYRLGSCRFLPGQDRLVAADGTSIPLPHRAAGVLELLLERPGRVVDKESLLDRVWGDTHVTDDALVQAVGVLRRALDDDARAPRFIQTVHGRGYRLLTDASELEAGPAPARPRGRGGRQGARYPRWRRRGVALTLLAAAVVTVAWIVADRAVAPATRPTPPVHFTLPLDGAELPAHGQGSMAVAPDGRSIVYLARDGSSGTRLVHRSLDDPRARPVPGSDGAAGPFFHPEGRRLAFFFRDELRIVSLEGGGVHGIGPLPFPAGGSWGPDGLVYLGSEEGLWSLDPERGVDSLRRLTRVDRAAGELGHFWPDALPEARGVLFTVWSGSAASPRIAALDLRDRRRVEVLEGATAPGHLAKGELTFVRGGSLMSAPLGPDLEVVGLPSTLSVGVFAHPYSGVGHYGISPEGTLAYLSGGPTMAPAGVLEVLVPGARSDERRAGTAPPPGPVKTMRPSPDGRRLAAVIEGDGRYGMWLADLTTGGWTELPSLGDNVTAPAWNRTGTRLAVALSGRDHDAAVVDTTTWQVREVLQLPGSQMPAGWIGDDALLVSEWRRRGGWDLTVLSTDGARLRDLASSAADEEFGRVSPGGGWVAYTRDDGEGSEVFVTSTGDEPGSAVRTSVGRGSDPRFSPDERRLYFRRDVELLSVGFDPERGAIVGAPASVARVQGLVHFEVLPDALLIYRAHDGDERRIHVVVRGSTPSRAGTSVAAASR